MQKKFSKCNTPFCRNKKAKGRTLCHKCRNRKYRSENVVSYVFDTLRTNAKRRGIVFTISIGYFKNFCTETNYLDNRGRHKFGASIDRIRNDIGYEPGNLQILTLTENVRKYFTEFHQRQLRYGT